MATIPPGPASLAASAARSVDCRASLSGGQAADRRQWCTLLRQYLPGLTVIEIPLLDALEEAGYDVHLHLLDPGAPDPGEVILYYLSTTDSGTPVLVLAGSGPEPEWAGAHPLLDWRLADPARPASVALAAQRLASLHRQNAEVADLERSLSAAEQDLEDFARWLSHDIRAPVRQAVQFADLLEQELGAGASPRAREYLGYIRGNGDQAQRMINDLRALSKLRGQPDSRLPIDLTELMEDLAAEFAGTLERYGVRLEVGELPTLSGDLSQLHLLFFHLLDNAIRYRAERPPVIRIDASRDDQRWIVTVQDNGLGMTPGVLDNALAPFHRGHTEIPAGTGVGLTFARRIAMLHGGTLWIESEAGHGTTVYVALPAASARRR